MPTCDPLLADAPADLPAALDTVSPLGFQRLINEYVDENPGKIPGAIPSLPLWLSYSYLLRTNAYVCASTDSLPASSVHTNQAGRERVRPRPLLADHVPALRRHLPGRDA